MLFLKQYHGMRVDFRSRLPFHRFENSTSRIENTPFFFSLKSHSAAVTAPRANPSLENAVWHISMESTPQAYVTVCVPGTSPCRTAVIPMVFSFIFLSSVSSAHPVYLPFSPVMSSASVMAVPLGASSLCIWWVSDMESSYCG